MIRYALSCSAGHAFDAWFGGSEAYEDQLAKGLVTCPQCGSAEVAKSLMAPAVATARKKAARQSAARKPVSVAANVSDGGEATALLRKLREHLVENADYVGNKFAEEARRIHYNEVERRGIYGEATSDEARSLAEEGIEFHPLPVLPEDHN